MPKSIKIDLPLPEVRTYDDPVTVPAAPRNLIFIFSLTVQHN